MNDNSVSSAGILMRKEQNAIIALTVWLILISVFMLLALQVDLNIFFVLFLIGIMVIEFLLDANFVQPGYLRYMRYLIAAGSVIFGVMVVNKVIEIFV